MSPPPTRASADLARLVAEGYDLSVVGGHLVVRGVPFVDAGLHVRRGVLATRLDLAGDRTVPPRSHVAWFGGGTPCDVDGRPLDAMIHARARRALAPGLEVEHMLSSRPEGGCYPDYYALVTTYVAQISGPAEALDPRATARVGGAAIEAVPTRGSPFRYVDTATSRAGIGALSSRLVGHSVGVVGLGGTGSYILDLLAKTPVARIHLWDHDAFDQHCAFRAPGAPSIEALRRRPSKVDYLAGIYSNMHACVLPHRVRLGPGNLDMLRHVDFCFIAVDSPGARRPIVEWLERAGTSFVDTGLGLHVGDDGLLGTVRVTTSTAAMRDHVRGRGRVPLDGGGGDDPYSTNIQTADLNCLAAVMAVIRWKKHVGFYADYEREHWSVYSVDGNAILNDERPAGIVA